MGGPAGVADAVRRPGGAARRGLAERRPPSGCPSAGPGPPEAALGHQGHAGRVVARGTRGGAGRRGGPASASVCAGGADDAAHGPKATGRRPAAGPEPPAERLLHGRAQPGRPSPGRLASAVTASTITRTTGSVPLGRSSTRPVLAELGLDLGHRAPDRRGASSQSAGSATATFTRTWGTRSTRPAESSASGPARPHHQVGQDQAGQDAVAGGGPVGGRRCGRTARRRGRAPRPRARPARGGRRPGSRARRCPARPWPGGTRGWS